MYTIYINTNFVVSSFYWEMWKFRFENKISWSSRGGSKCMKKHVCFSIARGYCRVSFYWFCCCEICDPFILCTKTSQSNLRIDCDYVFLYRYTEKIFGKLGPLPALYYSHSLHMASDLQVIFFLFPNEIKSYKFTSVTV